MTARQVLGYVRVSTEKQAELGLSLDAQTAKIRAMASLHDLVVADIIIDGGASAKSLNRPGLTWLLAQIEAGAVETVIIAKLDRLTRSVVDLASLLKRFERRRVSLVSVAETLDTASAMGRAILNIMVTISQWEREANGERTREVMRHKRAKGQRVGTLPFGFQPAPDDRKGDRKPLLPNPVEQERLARIYALRHEGRSTRQISATLNADGATTRKGTPWRFQYVARILRRHHA